MKTALGFEQAYQEIEQIVRRRGARAAQAVVEYLACFPSTKSEIVVPIFRNGAVIGEIDIDSSDLNAFGPADQRFLERVAELLASLRS